MNKKKFWWWIFLVDILIAASYIGAFYLIYYRMPRQLESEAIQISDALKETEESQQSNSRKRKTENHFRQQETQISENRSTNMDADSLGNWAEQFKKFKVHLRLGLYNEKEKNDFLSKNEQ